MKRDMRNTRKKRRAAVSSSLRYSNDLKWGEEEEK